MGTRMKTMLSYYAKLAGGTWEDGQPLTPEKAETAKKELLIQIGFFQHERLIHLIVTVLFAVLTVITLLANLFLQEPLLLVLSPISGITICLKTGSRNYMNTMMPYDAVELATTASISINTSFGSRATSTHERAGQSA